MYIVWIGDPYSGEEDIFGPYDEEDQAEAVVIPQGCASRIERLYVPCQGGEDGRFIVRTNNTHPEVFIGTFRDHASARAWADKNIPDADVDELATPEQLARELA